MCFIVAAQCRFGLLEPTPQPAQPAQPPPNWPYFMSFYVLLFFFFLSSSMLDKLAVGPFGGGINHQPFGREGKGQRMCKGERERETMCTKMAAASPPLFIETNQQRERERQQLSDVCVCVIAAAQVKQAECVLSFWFSLV